MTPPASRKQLYANARHRVKTNKVISRLAYNPRKHKQKRVKDMRQALQMKMQREPPQASTPSIKVKFGSINVNGLSFDTCWAVEQLLVTRGFDVRNISTIENILIKISQVLALSETFQRADRPSTLNDIPGFKIWRVERRGDAKGGGGLAMIYRDCLASHQWTPPVPSNLDYVASERQWLLLDGNNEKCAFLHIYVACQNSRSDSFLQWNEDLFHLVTQEAKTLRRQGYIVLALGDFNTRVGAIPGLEGNTPDINQNTPMFMSFVTEVNMIILNTLPISKGLFTRFMDNSGLPGTRSLLDYGLVDGDHQNTVTSFTIDEDARFDCGSDHALLESYLEFGYRPKVKWSYNDVFQYNIPEDTDFTEYHSALDTFSSTIRLHEFEDMCVEDMLPHVSSTLTRSAEKCFGLKVKKKKKGNRLPQNIIQLIRMKNEVSRKYHEAVARADMLESERLLGELQALKEQVKESIAEVKLGYRTKLRNKLLTADPTRKKFWRFLRSQMKVSGEVSALKNKEDRMVFEQSEIEEAVLEHFGEIFKGQRHPVYANPPPVDQVQICLDEMEQLLLQEPPNFQPDQFEQEVCSPYSFLELDTMLKNLPNGKASGYDCISNEMLKNVSAKFKHYLLIFLNKIISTGTVPPDMNIGKCILIFKGGDSLNPAQYRYLQIIH